MAVDTRAKRLSMLGFSALDDVITDPSGTVDAAERADFLNLYRGIALGDPPDVVPVTDQRQEGRIIVTSRKHGRSIISL